MSGEVTLRRAGPSDAMRIRQLTHEAYAKWVAIIGRGPKPMTADYVEAVRTHRFDLLESGPSQSGIRLLGLIETVTKAGHLLIENVAVAPAFQKRGYGRLLLSHAEDIAAGAGFNTIRLYTNKKFTGNIALYISLGYAVDHEEAMLGSIIVHMSKSWPSAVQA